MQIELTIEEALELRTALVIQMQTLDQNPTERNKRRADRLEIIDNKVSEAMAKE